MRRKTALVRKQQEPETATTPRNTVEAQFVADFNEATKNGTEFDEWEANMKAKGYTVEFDWYMPVEGCPLLWVDSETAEANATGHILSTYFLHVWSADEGEEFRFTAGKIGNAAHYRIHPPTAA